MGVMRKSFCLADNCVGQNKNNAAIPYLLWHTMTGRNKSAFLSFIIAGNTKFVPDNFFGLFKCKFCHSDINSLVDFCVSVTLSSNTGQNKIQLTADAIGNSLVTWYNWTGFLSEFFQPLYTVYEEKSI